MTTHPKLHPLPVTETGSATRAAVEDRDTRRVAPAGLRSLQRAAAFAVLMVPALLTAYLGFATGGLYPEDHVAVLALLALALMGHSLLSPRPFAGLGALGVVLAGALLALAVWALASGGWSDAPGRALLEAQRTALYGLAFLLFAALPRPRGGLATMVRGIALAILVVCGAGVATRLFPDVFEVSGMMAESRLSFPITYWNGLGILAAIGVVLCLHHACHEREAVVARVLGAAGLPLAAVALFFTFSRGATAAVAIGVLAYLVVGRPRGALAGLVAVLPTTYLAVRAAYDADLLASEENAASAAAAQGHDVAAVLIAACLAAALLRLLLTPLDRAVRDIRLPKLSPTNAIALAVVTAAALGAGLLAFDVPGKLERSYDRFVSAERSGADGRDDARTRLGNTSLGTRRDHWDVAVDEFSRHRLAGAGAGTYETLWLRHRPTSAETSEAHSLYFETMAELGVVGLALLVVALLAILAGLLARARGPRRPLYAAIFAASLIWILHAGIDWDWELPAVSLWMFALAGAALASHSGRERWPARVASGWIGRTAVTAVCLLVAFGAVRTVIADAQLDDARRAFESGDCRTAGADARSSIAAVASRARPFEILAYCQSDQGRHAQAIESMRAAIDLDPAHWRYRYGLAIVRAAAGEDPRPGLRAARRLNPLGQILARGTTADQLARSAPERWPRLAERATRPDG
jgi:O-antigen ligase